MLFLLTLICGLPDTPQRPNFLLVLTDDHGYGDVSVYRGLNAPDGNKVSEIRTPHIDRLAHEGMLFTRMRANCTVCSPSRAAILSGRFPDRVGVPGVIRTDPANSWGYFSPEVPTLANYLRDAGYQTAIVGKWHLGLETPNTPNDRGFDFFHGFLGDMLDNYTTHTRHGQNLMRRNAEAIEPNGHATDLFTDWSIDYLQQRAADKEPFFLYLAYNAPHFPIEPPISWLENVRNRETRMKPKRAANVALIEHLDNGIGRVLTTLRETKLDQNTVVVFTSDNGGSLPHAQNNDPWRDGKQSHYDGGLRVPFIIRWPHVVTAGSQCHYAGQTFDIFATFLEAAGVTAPVGMDAVSLLPLLRGGEPSTSARELYFVRREGGPEYGGKSYETLIRGDWKLAQSSPYSPLELYNLKNDPQERNNVIEQEPKVAAELNSLLRAHIQRGGATPWQKPER